MIGVPLAARFRPQTLLCVNLLGTFISLSSVFAIRTSFPLLLTATIGIGASLASTFPTLLAFAAQRVRMSGKAYSLFAMGGAMRSLLFPASIGQLFAPFNARGAMLAIYATLLTLIFCFAILFAYSSSARHRTR